MGFSWEDSKVGGSKYLDVFLFTGFRVGMIVRLGLGEAVVLGVYKWFFYAVWVFFSYGCFRVVRFFIRGLEL